MISINLKVTDHSLYILNKICVVVVFCRLHFKLTPVKVWSAFIFSANSAPPVAIITACKHFEATEESLHFCEGHGKIFSFCFSPSWILWCVLGALLKRTSHPLSNLNMVLMFAATICWSYSATILPSIRGWSVFSPVSYSRRRDGRREEQASSCRFTDRRRHGDSAHDSSYLHVGLHVPPPDLQHQPFLYRGQSAELPFCCSRRLPPYVYSKVPNTSYISLFFPGIFFFFFFWNVSSHSKLSPQRRPNRWPGLKFRRRGECSPYTDVESPGQDRDTMVVIDPKQCFVLSDRRESEQKEGFIVPDQRERFLVADATWSKTPYPTRLWGSAATTTSSKSCLFGL